MAEAWLLLGSVFYGAQALAQQQTDPPPDPDEVVTKEDGEESAIEQREEWFYRPRQAGTSGDMARLRNQAVTFTRAREALLGRSPEGMGIWTARGPSSSRFGNWNFGRISGRVTSLAKDWGSNILYAGSASGGVWKTTNDGASWTPVFESAGTMTIGAVTVDPTTPATVWVGTGENTKYWCEEYFGIGLLRSTDRGATWEVRNGSGANTLENLSVFAGVLVDPRNSNNLVVGGRSRDCATGSYVPGGIYTSTDAGVTWTKRLTGYVTSLTRSTNPDILWAGVYLGGVYKSTDNGVTWTLQTASALPSGSNTYRVEVAAAPSDVNTVYALHATVVSNGRAELWRTTNGGTSWTMMTFGTTACDGQCQYNLVLAVHPTLPSTLYRGTIQVFRSTNSGTSWTNLTGSWGSSQKVHQDTHAILVNPTNGAQFYVGSDGGVWKTTNGTSGSVSFSNLNSNLNLTQFYDVGIHPTSDDIICGGAQDNSSLARTTENVWDVQTVTGDGFVCAIHPTDTKINYITSYPSGSLPSVYRSTDGILGEFDDITGSDSGIAPTSRIDWVTPYTLSRTSPSTLFLGTYQMHRSTNGGTAWSPVGPADMTSGGAERISTVTVSRVNGSYAYAGTTNGYVWRSSDGGTTWNFLSGALPARRINDVEADPTDPARAFCVVSGFNTAHLYEYTQGDWVARGDGLPNVPANTVLAVNAKDVYVGTDVGVFVSTDGGKNFVPFNFGLPAGLVVSDLEYNATTGTITAGTYGRGAWQHTLCTAIDQCHDAGVHDPGTGLCTNPAKPDGATCDDGDPCTTGDSCQAGACSNGAPVICEATDDCHAAGHCDGVTGLCSNPARPDGSVCNDGDACTQADACLAGSCLGSDPVVCTASDACHVVGTCDPQSGTCPNPTAPDGTACDDGNGCTTSDACASGTCIGAPVVCAPADACHVAGTCDSQTGACSNPLAEDGTACSDGNACTQLDSCTSGACIGSNPVVCVAGDPCHVAGECDPLSGACSNPNAPEQTPCDDGDACTQVDDCRAGACTGADPVVCPGGGPCYAAGTCDPLSGACSDPVALDGAACEDGDPCTGGETCLAGTCGTGAPITAPPEIENVEVAADKTTFSWPAAAYATQYRVLRGGTASLPVGSGADEVCFTDLAGPAFVAVTDPAPETGFWYLVRGENTCGIGTFGTQSDGSPRSSLVCP